MERDAFLARLGRVIILALDDLLPQPADERLAARAGRWRKIGGEHV
ncbi:hypothetical protein BH18ACT15_BH18ACT15_05010 [soil metagenome]